MFLTRKRDRLDVIAIGPKCPLTAERDAASNETRPIRIEVPKGLPTLNLTRNLCYHQSLPSV